MSTALSILYLSFNEEDVFGQSLESIKSIADEIVVIDSGSTDSTVQIAESAGAHVYHRPLKTGVNSATGVRKMPAPLDPSGRL